MYACVYIFYFLVNMKFDIIISIYLLLKHMKLLGKCIGILHIYVLLFV
jgi:hypothetical protein